MPGALQRELDITILLKASILRNTPAYRRNGICTLLVILQYLIQLIFILPKGYIINNSSFLNILLLTANFQHCHLLHLPQKEIEPETHSHNFWDWFHPQASRLFSHPPSQGVQPSHLPGLLLSALTVLTLTSKQLWCSFKPYTFRASFAVPSSYLN